MKKIILIILVSEILFMSILGRKIDYYLMEKNNYPIFSFPLVAYRDGGTTVFYGTTYKIIALQSLSNDSKGTSGYKTGTILLNWFQKVDLDRYINDENTSRFIADDLYYDMNNGFNVLVSFLIHLQILVCIIILIKERKKKEDSITPSNFSISKKQLKLTTKSPIKTVSENKINSWLNKYLENKKKERMTAKQEYICFLNDNFGFRQLRKPLFYCSEFGLRLNLQTGETFDSTRQSLDRNGEIIPLIGDTNTEEYFEEGIRRLMDLFEFVFDAGDNIFFVLNDYKYRKSRIKLFNYAFKQIENLKKEEISYFKTKELYYLNDKSDNWNTGVIKFTTNRINYRNIFTAIVNSDFLNRQPRLEKKEKFTSKEIYFVNIDKKLIFNTYDDRGVDIVAAEKETLRPIYEKFNNWLLDYDRKEMDKLFE